jgi:hypothetical protein
VGASDSSGSEDSQGGTARGYTEAGSASAPPPETAGELGRAGKGRPAADAEWGSAAETADISSCPSSGGSGPCGGHGVSVPTMARVAAHHAQSTRRTRGSSSRVSARRIASGRGILRGSSPWSDSSAAGADGGQRYAGAVHVGPRKATAGRRAGEEGRVYEWERRGC